MRIAIVAGELSGDLLGGRLIRALRVHYPDAKFEGIGGHTMLAENFTSHYPLELLSVMGLVEVLKHYREIKTCRDQLCQYFLDNPPDIFIGIDAPDFNLGLETALKKAGIPTVHYVSPSVWAWREYRLKKIRHACDLMLTLLPFEAAYYERHNLPVAFVGHPLADEIPLKNDQAAAQQHLNLPPNKTYIALLAGSRRSEVERLATIFTDTAAWLDKKIDHCTFIIPLAREEFKAYFENETSAQLDCHFFAGDSRTVMAAADVVILASGTATLEAMLLKRPMVVAYRLAPLTYHIAKYIVNVSYFSLPNLLADQPLVPEFLQHDVTPENLGKAALNWLQQPEKTAQLQQDFIHLHQQLAQTASQRAATAIHSLLTKTSTQHS